MGRNVSIKFQSPSNGLLRVRYLSQNFGLQEFLDENGKTILNFQKINNFGPSQVQKNQEIDIISINDQTRMLLALMQ